MILINIFLFAKNLIYLSFLFLLFTDKLFDEIVQDFVSNPENLQQVEEAIVLNRKSEKRYCCTVI